MILYSLQARVGYFLGTHLPEQTRELAEAVDATLRKCYLVCFGTDLLNPEGQRGSRFQEDPSFVRDLFGLKIRLGGGGYRRTTRRAPFLNNLNNVAPQLVSSASAPGLWQSLATVLGDDSFNDANEKQRRAALYASGSCFEEALKAEWQRLQQLRTEAMAATGAQDATKSILDADHNSFGRGTSKPH